MRCSSIGCHAKIFTLSLH